MFEIENIDKLTPELVNNIYATAIKPHDLIIFNKSLKYLNISSIGHFVCMGKNDFMTTLEQPNIYWKGAFMQHIESEIKRIGKSYNIIESIKFIIGRHIFCRKSEDIHFQFYSHFRRSSDPNFRLVAMQMFLIEQKISCYTEDFKLLERMKKINSELLIAEQQYRSLKKEIIINKGAYYQFESYLNTNQLANLCKGLINDKDALFNKRFEGALLFIFNGELTDIMDLEFPIKWNYSGIELMYLFHCLIEFRMLDSNEVTQLSHNVYKNFVDRDEHKLDPRSLSRVCQRAKIGIVKVEEIQREKKGRYQKIYEIVKIVAKTH